jgi:aspartyl-tRNA(Asn)/glutamyl-tRNA(Gln) amidotransferase subunit C
MDIQELQQTAAMAMLELHDDEVSPLAEAISSLLDYVAKMDEIDLEHTEPATHATAALQQIRDDNPKKFPKTEDLLNNSADHNNSYFIIPNVL